jgi:hypothetical protein
VLSSTARVLGRSCMGNGLCAYTSRSATPHVMYMRCVLQRCVLEGYSQGVEEKAAARVSCACILQSQSQ